MNIIRNFSLNCRNKEMQLGLCKDFGSIVKCFDWGFVRSCLFFEENSMYFSTRSRHSRHWKRDFIKTKMKRFKYLGLGRGLLRLENKVRGVCCDLDLGMYISFIADHRWLSKFGLLFFARLHNLFSNFFFRSIFYRWLY